MSILAPLFNGGIFPILYKLPVLHMLIGAALFDKSPLVDTYSLRPSNRRNGAFSKTLSGSFPLIFVGICQISDLPQFLVGVFASLGSVLFGYDLGNPLDSQATLLIGQSTNPEF
jgi:hypothetical protein